MGPAYEITSLGRGSRHRLLLVATLLLIALGVALAKPWGGPPQAALVASDPPTPAAPVALPLVAVDAAPWPAQPSPGLDATDPVSTAQATRLLVAHAGTWGVGDGGSGPRLTRDGVWMDWAPLQPGPPSPVPDALSAALSSASCTGLTTLADRPSVLAVTASADIGAGWRVAGWWSDGVQVLSISSSVHQSQLPGERSVAYLQRVDRAPWPDGRYELHVTSGHRTYALSVCIGPV